MFAPTCSAMRSVRAKNNKPLDPACSQSSSKCRAVLPRGGSLGSIVGLQSIWSRGTQNDCRSKPRRRAQHPARITNSDALAPGGELPIPGASADPSSPELLDGTRQAEDPLAATAPHLENVMSQPLTPTMPLTRTFWGGPT